MTADSLNDLNFSEFVVFLSGILPEDKARTNEKPSGIHPIYRLKQLSDICPGFPACP
jgi:hypothetical protein